MPLPQRVLIVGCPGSGKSTLARQLAPLLDLPIIHLDREYWRAGWVETDAADWEAKVLQLVDDAIFDAYVDQLVAANGGDRGATIAGLLSRPFKAEGPSI